MPASNEVRKRRRREARARAVAERIRRLAAQGPAVDEGEVAHLSTDDEECHLAAEDGRRQKNKRIRESSTPYAENFNNDSVHSSAVASAVEGSLRTSACSTPASESDKDQDVPEDVAADVEDHISSTTNDESELEEESTEAVHGKFEGAYTFSRNLVVTNFSFDISERGRTEHRDETAAEARRRSKRCIHRWSKKLLMRSLNHQVSIEGAQALISACIDNLDELVEYKRLHNRNPPQFKSVRARAVKKLPPLRVSVGAVELAGEGDYVEVRNRNTYPSELSDRTKYKRLWQQQSIAVSNSI